MIADVRFAPLPAAMPLSPDAPRRSNPLRVQDGQDHGAHPGCAHAQLDALPRCRRLEVLQPGGGRSVAQRRQEGKRASLTI